MQYRLRLQLICWLTLWLSVTSGAQSNPRTPLQQLRDQLVVSNGLCDHDVLAIISQRALNDTAQRMAGLEIKLANGVVLQLKSVVLELKPAAARVQVGVAVNSSSQLKSAHFRLWGQLGSGAVRGANLRLPFQLTEVAFGTEDTKSLSLLKLLLRDWLTPEKWNAVLPPLEIPLQLNPTLEIPAATFDADGEMPMTLTTPAYQVEVNFWLASFVVLDGRVVLALNLQPPAESRAAPRAIIDQEDETDTAVSQEIARLTEHLALAQDVRLRVRQNAINVLLTKLAAARALDLTVQLKPGRLRAEEIDALLGRIVNYTDVESGDGHADIVRLTVEAISATRVFVRLTGQGELNAKVKGREYGVPYQLSPRGRFTINHELLPLEIASHNERIVVRAAAGAVVPVRVNMTIEVLGHPLGLMRTIQLPARHWLKDFELPALFTQEVALPRQIVVEKDQPLRVAESAISRYTISRLRLETKEETLEISADIVAANK